MSQLTNDIKRKLRNFGVDNIMMYIIATIGVIGVFDFIFPVFNIWSYLYFDRSLILGGQIWRVISFLFLPLDSSPFFLLISLYFYYFIGSSLESYWGNQKFILYLLTGAVLTICGGFIGGYAENNFLYLSMFIAYALLDPEKTFYILFIIPLKAKWLAAVDFIYMLFFLVNGSFPTKLSVIASLLTLLIFFGKNIINRIKSKKRFNDFKNSFNNR